MLNKIEKNKAFTLLEIIVAVGIFALVAVIAVGSLVKITGLNRRAQARQATLTNIAFALESITREMRYGTNFYCSNFIENFNVQDLRLKCQEGMGNSRGNSSTLKVLLFRSSEIGSYSGNSVSCRLVYAYWFRDGSDKFILKKSKQRFCDDPISLNTAVSIIDDSKIELTNGTAFSVRPNNDGVYAIASISLVGHSKGEKDLERTDFDIRTAVSQRLSN